MLLATLFRFVGWTASSLVSDDVHPKYLSAAEFETSVLGGER